MPHPDRLRVKLAAANAIPGRVRAAMMADPGAVRPGAVDVLDRFYADLRARRTPSDCPPRATFDTAAGSEPTLATLLRTLEHFVPEMSLAEGREVRRAWYRKRGGAVRTPLTPDAVPEDAPPERWPVAWRPAHGKLLASGCTSSTVRRYIASLNRCAVELAALGVAPEVDRFRALLLGETFAARGLSPRTVRNYLGAFLRLAQLLDLDADTRDGIANAFETWQARAALAPKQRTLKLESWHESGHSLETAIATATDLLAQIKEQTGGWRADLERRRRAAIVLLVALNTVPRTGDMARWRLGEELRRDPDGLWSLSYIAQKTGSLVSFSRLWPETCAALDLLLLSGRPDRMLATRYTALKGCNWLRHGHAPVPSKYPSQLIGELTGLSSHPLRTLAADLLLEIDPATGAEAAGALLGHRDGRSVDAYRAAAEGRAAAATWATFRDRLRAGRYATTGSANVLTQRAAPGRAPTT